MRSITQNVFQCIFDFALLPTKNESTPNVSAALPLASTPSQKNRCTQPHNIVQCSFDELLLPPEVAAQVSSESPELHGVHITPLVKRCTKCKETKDCFLGATRVVQKIMLGIGLQNA